MPQPRLANFFWISGACHLVAVICLISFAKYSSLQHPELKAVYFVNLEHISTPAPASHPPSAHVDRKIAPLPKQQTPAKPEHVTVGNRILTHAEEKKDLVISEHATQHIAAEITPHPVQTPRFQGTPSSAGLTDSETAIGRTTNPGISPTSSILSQRGGDGRQMADVTFGSGPGPSFIRRALPIYPMAARRFNREGKVVLRLTIDESGTLNQVEVIEDPGYGFAAAAIDSLKKSSFSPARRDGRPVSSKAILPVRFALQGND